MEANVANMRQFAGIDTDVASDTVVKGYLDAAADLYARAGVPSTTDGDLYQFWVLNLAAWMYDHRGGTEPVSGLFVTSVHQLRPKRGDR